MNYRFIKGAFVSKKTFIFFILILPFVLPACNENSFNLKIRFDQVHGLKSGDRLLFGQNHIGTVDRVVYSDQGRFLVDVSIFKDFDDMATEHARFFIISDPQDKKNKAVELIHIREGGVLLQNNATVEGFTETAVLLQQVAEAIENGRKTFETQIEQFTKDMKDIPESEEFKNLESEFKRLAEEMKRSGQAARDKINKEVLPQLREELENLRKRLRELGREEEMKPLEVEMENIQKI